MIFATEWNSEKYKVDTDKPLDISIPIQNDHRQPNCFYAPLFEAEPVRSGDFVGAIAKGGPVNFFNIKINPHGNGTHTECVGHIKEGNYTINNSLKKFHWMADLISIYPEKMLTGDKVIFAERLLGRLPEQKAEALVIRTLPNDEDKMVRNYSGTNPAFLDESAMKLIVDSGYQHLLIDLPSVDREEDEGRLSAHKTFWNAEGEIRRFSTITEMIYVDNNIKDGLYLLNVHITSLELDVSPSKPVLYRLEKDK